MLAVTSLEATIHGENLSRKEKENPLASFPVTYIVSSKDNLTVLTTVSTEDDWNEYVKNNKIKNIYMDLRSKFL